MANSEMVSVYRHDAHKMRGQSHKSAPGEWFGLSVNSEVPNGADGDAADMSRPNGKPEQVLHGHETHYRRSLVTGNTVYDPQTFTLQEYEHDLNKLLGIECPETMHRRWLDDDVVSAFNESVYYPYTSLKYHTLLVGALHDAYRHANNYDDLGLYLHTDGDIRRYKTVFHYPGGGEIDAFSLTIDEHTRGRSAKLASYPFRNFSSVWNRLPEHPWPEFQPKAYNWIDANLRRIEAWSTALQYLEDALMAGENHA